MFFKNKRYHMLCLLMFHTVYVTKQQTTQNILLYDKEKSVLINTSSSVTHLKLNLHKLSSKCHWENNEYCITMIKRKNNHCNINTFEGSDAYQQSSISNIVQRRKNDVMMKTMVAASQFSCEKDQCLITSIATEIIELFQFC